MKFDFHHRRRIRTAGDMHAAPLSLVHLAVSFQLFMVRWMAFVFLACWLNFYSALASLISIFSILLPMHYFAVFYFQTSCWSLSSYRHEFIIS